ncbi:Ankyrin-1 [Metarhizium brunneum]|uniref:Ankyrin-1 n=1 Tax=Metarhizium brunneum TaxID=500148 RepID=A0A7D5ZAH8_9HYPO
MAVPLTFLVLVTGVAGDSALPDGGLGNMHSYLSQHFPAAHRIVLNTVESSAEDVMITVPDLRSSARNLLQSLDRKKDKLEGERAVDVKNHGDGPKQQGPNIPAPKLVFLCHDIGGFVVKQALLLANSEPCFEWVARATAAVLFFETPHTVPTHLSWERLMVRMLGQTESVLDFASFIRYLSDYASQLETEFEGISGTHHMINFLSRESHYAVVTRENLPCPIYSCDQIHCLDCDPKEMWKVSDQVSWADTIRRVISTHLSLDSKGRPTRSYAQFLDVFGAAESKIAPAWNASTPLDPDKEGIFTKDTFRGLLRSILSGCAGKATFCIINGLDHYTAEARDELLRDLCEMRTSSQAEFKVLTVGSASHVQYGKPGYPLVVYSQERILAAGELERLAKTRIRSMAAVNPAWKTLDLESEQVKRLWTGSATLFELCQKMDFLEKGETLSTTDEAIAMVATLPADFTVFFRTLATKYDFLRDGGLGAAVLPWLTRSVRPMTVPELAVCAALARTSTETLTLQHLQKSILWDFHRDLENELGPIIRISGETVEMRHRIYQDLVLADSNALGKANVHLDILTTCLIYLRQISPSWKHGTEFRQEHRLAEYAALHWPQHYHEVRDKATAKPVVLSLLQNEEQFTVWLDIYSHYATRSAEEESFPKTPIQVAAYLGLTEVLSELVANLHPSNEDTELSKAMEYAASKGHANVIRLLAELGVRAEGALLRASWLGDNATVTELLKSHRTYINSRGGPDGFYNPLLQAARCGHVDSFAKLQSEGADTNAVAAHTNLTALHLAARIGQRAIVQILITAKVPLASVDEQGYGALHYAAEGGFEEIVRCMIIAANDPAILADVSRVSQVLLANDQTRDSNTPLHLAASNGHLKTVETLLEMKAEPGILNDRKYTPLHCAAEGGFPSVVKALLKVGTVAENQGEQSTIEVQPSPVELAVKNGHLGTVRELRSSRFYDDSEVLSLAFATACREGTNDCALYILHWYSEVSFAGGPLLDVDGNTALHLAARDGNVRLFQKLMDSKYVPIDSLNKKGLSPLHIAASSGSLAIIQLFKDDSALGGTTANGTGRTLLHIAAEAGYLHVVEWLLDYTSLKKETATAVKDTAIMLAAVGKHEPIVKLLLDSKYAVPTGNLLHVAVLNSWKDVTKLLTSCDFSVLNWIDDTTSNAALHLAVVIKNPTW